MMIIIVPGLMNERKKEENDLDEKRKKSRKKGWGQREFMFKGGRKGRNDLEREGVRECERIPILIRGYFAKRVSGGCLFACLLNA